ncbi:MAG TPA: hypothetical protein V6D10_12570 [Trichocoleus sp.]
MVLLFSVPLSFRFKTDRHQALSLETMNLTGGSIVNFLADFSV